MKKYLKLVISCMLCVCMITAGLAIPVSADTDLPEGEVSDGIYADGEILVSENDYIMANQHQEEPEVKTFDSSYDISRVVDSDGKYNGYDVMTADEAAQYCIDLIKDHQTTIGEKFLIAVPYSVSGVGSGSPYTYAYNMYEAAFTQAFNDSLFVDGFGGDYLLYSMYGRPFYATTSCKTFTDGDDGLALIYATAGKATYYTTASQEEEFKTKAASVVSDLKKSAGSSDYDKVCTVFDYICDNVAYDYDGLSKQADYTMYTAYKALCQGTAVCQGYANLFYVLCNELGVPCRIVAGEAFNGSTSGAHAWNIVQLDGTWYHVDSTWGASYSQWYTGRYFFLQSEQNFVNGHANTRHIMDYMTGIQYIDYTGSDFLSTYKISQVNDYCAHEYSQKKVQEATCTEDGYEVEVCSICGETYEETIPATGHEWEVTKEPDCENTGVRTCTKCGETSDIPAKGHDYEATETVEAGCVDDGYTVYTCKTCGHEHHEDIVPSLGGHDYELTDSIPMTHTEDGQDIYTCTVCGDEYDEVFPAVSNHVYDSFTKIEDSDYERCGYDYEATCAICGETEYILSDLHSFKDYTYTDEDGNEDKNCQICEHCGLIIDEDENIIDREEQSFYTHECEDHNHTVKATEASCMESGHEELQRCSECGLILSEITDDTFEEPTGHVEKEYHLDATCTENGYEGVIYCETCHELIDHGKLIPATGHSLVTESGHEETCIHDGLTDKVYCETCGFVEEEAEVIPAYGHKDIEYPATCTTEGYTKCANCGVITSITSPALGHDWVLEETRQEKTCYEDGHEELIVCSRCDEVYGDADGSVIPAGHTLTYFRYKLPTEEEDGNIQCWYCYGCDTFFLDEDATQPATYDDIVLKYSDEETSGNTGDTGDTGNTGDTGSTGTDGTGTTTKEIKNTDENKSVTPGVVTGIGSSGSSSGSGSSNGTTTTTTSSGTTNSGTTSSGSSGSSETVGKEDTTEYGKEDTTPSSGESSSSSNVSSSGSTKTDDANNMIFWIIAALGSFGLAGIGTVTYKRRINNR